MKIVADSKIPYLKGLLEPVAQEVLYVPGSEITNDVVRDAQVLLTRTRTRCDKALLEGSAVEFIGTATIGTDHIDLDYCRSRGIKVVNAPGCNAPAVAQWVHATILQWIKACSPPKIGGVRGGMTKSDGYSQGESHTPQSLPPLRLSGTSPLAGEEDSSPSLREQLDINRPLTLGIVGVGHVGSIVARWAQQLGYRVLLNDPPLAECCARESGIVDRGSRIEVLSPLPSSLSLEKTLPSPLYPLTLLQQECDIITFHTPLTRDGDHPTWHLCDEAFLNGLNRCSLIINAARGAVCDNEALLRWNGDVALDCWEGEPAINAELLDKAFVATPHIAGYSLQGKQRGTAMILEALNRHYGWDIKPVQVNKPFCGAEHVSPEVILDSYDPLADTALLKSSPETFESQRNTYNLRQEV